MIRVTLLLSLLFNLLHANWFTNLFDPTPTSPLSLPIDLSKAGTSVESEVRIDEDGLYEFEIDIPYIKWRDDTLGKKTGVADVSLVGKIIGFNRYEPKTGKLIKTVPYAFMNKTLSSGGINIDKNYNGDGTIIPMKVEIVKIEPDKSKRVILDKVYETKGTGHCSMCRMIIEREFKAGKYHIKIKNLTAIKEMKNRKANIRFGRAYHGK